VTSSGKLFQTLAPTIGKARLPTVGRRKDGTSSWLDDADRILRRLGVLTASSGVVWLKTRLDRGSPTQSSGRRTWHHQVLTSTPCFDLDLTLTSDLLTVQRWIFCLSQLTGNYFRQVWILYDYQLWCIFHLRSRTLKFWPLVFQRERSFALVTAYMCNCVSSLKFRQDNCVRFVAIYTQFILIEKSMQLTLVQCYLICHDGKDRQIGGRTDRRQR